MRSPIIVAGRQIRQGSSVPKNGRYLSKAKGVLAFGRPGPIAIRDTSTDAGTKVQAGLDHPIGPHLVQLFHRKTAEAAQYLLVIFAQMGRRPAGNVYAAGQVNRSVDGAE